jgi:hypothetical protein
MTISEELWAKTETNFSNLDTLINGDASTTVSLGGNNVESPAKAIQEMQTFNLKGAWVSGTAYVLKDIVTQSNTVYVCVTAHTAGTSFTTDLTAAKWAVYQMDINSAITFGSTVSATKFTAVSTSNVAGQFDCVDAGTSIPDAISGVIARNTNTTVGNMTGFVVTDATNNPISAVLTKYNDRTNYYADMYLGTRGSRSAGSSMSVVMAITASGYVGINTTAPSTMFHIQQSISSVSLDTLVTIENTNTNDGTLILFKKVASGVTVTTPQAYVGFEGEARSRFWLGTQTENDTLIISGATARIIVKGTGNVGITDETYIDSIAYPLHVIKNTSGINTLFAIENKYTNAGAQILFKNVTNGTVTAPQCSLGYAADSSSDFYINSNGVSIKMYTTSTLRMTIDSSGNVGIGTSSFGSGAAKVLTLANGTQGAALTDTVQITSTDLTAGNTILSIRTEGSGVVKTGTPTTSTRVIAISINGTVLYIPASTTSP